MTTGIMNLMTTEMTEKIRAVSLYNVKKSTTDSSTMKTDLLGFDIKELEPGKTHYPYHYHSKNEEIYIIIQGEVSLRQNDEVKILKENDFAFLPAGELGAHQLYNHSDKPVKYPGISSKAEGDICFNPDSGKINAEKGEIYRIDDRKTYYDGEEKLAEFWNSEK